MRRKRADRGERLKGKGLRSERETMGLTMEEEGRLG